MIPVHRDPAAASRLATRLCFFAGGFAMACWAPLVPYAKLRLGASNLVPVLFSAAGRQQAMPMGLAIAAMSSLGYAGILAGPAVLGFVAKALSLPAAFLLLGVMMLALPLAARRVTRA